LKEEKQKKQANHTIEHDAELLYKSMKGLGTDDKTLVEVITTRPRHHLLEVKKVYQQKYGHTLEKDIQGDTSGHYEDILLALVTERNYYFAQLLRKAVKGAGTNEHILTEILCLQPNSRLRKILFAYAHEFKRSLIEDVLDDLSGDTKQLYAQILTLARPESGSDLNQAKADAQALFKAGEGKLGTNEASFIDIIAKRSREHLVLVNKVYADAHGHSLAQAITKETSGHFRDSLLALISPVGDWWADKVRDAVKGAGTKDDFLVRTFGSVTKSTLKAAANVYLQKHNTTFRADIQSDVSGNYGKVLVTLIPQTL